MKWEHREAQMKTLIQGWKCRQAHITAEEHRQMYITKEICIMEHRQAHINLKAQIQVCEHRKA